MHSPEEFVVNICSSPDGWQSKKDQPLTKTSLLLVLHKPGAGFSLTQKCVRFGACFRQMNRKMNLHCDTLDAHNAC